MFDLDAEGILRDFQVVIGLEIGPELRAGSEVARQPQRRVRGDRAATAHNVVHARNGNPEFQREPVHT